jgi:hypothetical protein
LEVAGFQPLIVALAPLPFQPTDEILEADEEEMWQRLVTVMDVGERHARDADCAYGRRSHAKCLGALRGELQIAPNLPAELAQGVFATPRAYDVLARLSHLPAERLDDRMVSSTRGLALRVFGVEGDRLPGHEGRFQDFVLDTGKSFNTRNTKTLLAAMGIVEATGPLPQGFKAAVSHAARVTNAALAKAGMASANLDVLGHPLNHPLGEAYYSQAPLRWGPFVAKLGVIPDAAPDIGDLDVTDPDSLRSAVQTWCTAEDLRFTVAVQLRVDADAMPIEDASKEWPEALSPYVPVGQVLFPRQDPFDPAQEHLVNRSMFSPWYGIEDHRPLGSIMRARRYVYRVLGEKRLQEMQTGDLPCSKQDSSDPV